MISAKRKITIPYRDPDFWENYPDFNLTIDLWLGSHAKNVYRRIKDKYKQSALKADHEHGENATDVSYMTVYVSSRRGRMAIYRKLLMLGDTLAIQRFYVPWWFNKYRAEYQSHEYKQYREAYRIGLLTALTNANIGINYPRFRQVVAEYTRKWPPYMYSHDKLWGWLFDYTPTTERSRHGLNLLLKHYGQYIIEKTRAIDADMKFMSLNTKSSMRTKKDFWAAFSKWLSPQLTPGGASWFKACLSSLAEDIDLSHDIDFGFQYITLKTHKTTRNFLPRKIITWLMQLSPDNEYMSPAETLYLQTSILGGLRISEACALSRRSLDLNNRLMVFRTKTGIPTKIPLPQQIYQHLLIHIEEVAKVAKGISGNAAIFKRLLRRIPACNDTYVDVVRYVKDKKEGYRVAYETLPVAEALTPHDLRRSAVVYYHNLGLSDIEICKICGWRPGSSVFNDFYNVVDEEDMVAKLEEAYKINNNEK